MKTAQTAELDVCYHCAQPCNSHPLRHENRSFCCDGCLTVYQLLQENNLCNYYNFQDGERIQPKARNFGERFAYLDDADTIAGLLQFNTESHAIIQLELPQMHCSSCVWLLEHLYRIDKGVQQSRVNFMDKTIAIDYNPQISSLRALVELLTTLGYEPHIRLDSLKSKPTDSQRMRIYRIAVSGFCFGNIMMLAFPEYFHIAEQGDEALQQTFAWLSLCLSIPALLFGGGEFFVSAWRALRSKYLNIDVPLALSIALTFGRSVFEISTHSGNGYLDSMTGIIFFMLIGRYFQHLTHHRIQFDRDYTSFFPISVSILKDDGTETTLPLTKLCIGQTIAARSGELVPADSVLISEDARIDYSFVTGESNPIHIRKGEIIYAGGRVTGSMVHCSVVKEVSQSYLTHLWNKENYANTEASHTWVDRVAQYFTLLLIAISLSAFFYWLPSGTERAFDALTTVLIVACPCAILLSATFTTGSMLRIFSKNGMYFKNADTIDKLASINHFVLDKTGTLTGRKVEIHFERTALTEAQKQLIHSAASQSNHPLSKALRDHLSSHTASYTDISFNELIGKGIEAQIGNSHILLGNSEFCAAHNKVATSETSVHVNIDGSYIGRFEFRFAWRENVEASVQVLKKQGNLSVVSGDNDADAIRLQQLLGHETSLSFRQLPIDKLNHVKALQQQGKQVAMIGDGLNDAGALLQSDCGITISDEVNNFSPACDIILEAKSFSKLESLLKLTRRSKTIIYLSFSISLLYNIVGVGLAVQGEMQPVFAAILMPLSTLSIIVFTTGASRFSAYRLGLS